MTHNSSPSDVDDVLRYLESHHVMSVATIGPEGPWNAAVFYASRGLELFFVSPPDTRHCRNIAHAPGVAITIHEDYAHWTAIKGIQMEASAHRIAVHEQSGVLARYRRKFAFLDGPAHAIGPIVQALRKSAWYRVTPSRVFFVNNEKGFGTRIEIPVGPPSGPLRV